MSESVPVLLSKEEVEATRKNRVLLKNGFWDDITMDVNTELVQSRYLYPLLDDVPVSEPTAVIEGG